MKTEAELIGDIRHIIDAFEQETDLVNLRKRVLTLVPAFENMRELGKSIIPQGLSISARNRLLKYFLAYPKITLNEKELALVAGISEWARRVRELRVEYGWKIVSGLTAKQMADEDEILDNDLDLKNMGPGDYVLLDPVQDRDAAFRWNVANEIRKKKGGSKEKILSYLRANVGKPVTGEELSYVANSSEWARRVRELRTEEGWPILTKMSGNPALPVGAYILEIDRQAPVHDRKINESVRRAVLRRDEYKCQKCGWHHGIYNRSDPRFLELHHIVHHANKGSNDKDNLITYCNICHDDIHRMDKTT